ncbi:hypothetical protein [Luteipulveratus mongoliensis]|uniref:Knr4/Smi1-like domain-containing protein n=1 Tax=Luteipulveratus mongoliensis TaxID=571913 RepID=A0A0K1JG32_9MICO|nr:hypothetical protein [Luteipulveratus mongoliensis]AKU15664.1 hypothetical protein VV02_07020 [Luteipulveratus mongoliensis]
MKPLSTERLPKDFWYPTGYIRVLESGLVDLEPWKILDAEQVEFHREGLALRYPARRLLPFANRQDMDDIACWDLERGNQPVVIIHDYASPGWESRGEFADFYSWLREAVEDFIIFDQV